MLSMLLNSLLMTVIGLNFVKIVYLQQNRNLFTPFLTSRRNILNWTRENEYDEDNETLMSELNEQGMNTLHEGNGDFIDDYKLRFRPVGPMPRLFWHKYPQKQTVSSTEMPEVSTSQMGISSEPPTFTPPTPPTTTAVTPTEILTTTTTTKRPSTVLPVFTTPNTIMRPPQVGLISSLKNILLYGSPVKANLLQKRPAATKSKGRGFLGLFEVIEFNNTKCTVEMGDIRSMEGVCYHDFECQNLGGISTQNCADGAGVCCIFLTSCGDTTEQPLIYFESPNYPKPVREMMICVLIINLRPDVEQLRLDFIMFELNRPTNGDCLDDQFIVSGQNMNYAVPILCGINTGQHIYLHVGNSFENKIYLSFFAKVPKGARSFNIKITQLETDLSPPNCLQYFTAMEGILKSFNYDIEGTVVDNTEATYLNNLNYAICLQRAKETCSVLYVTEHGNNIVPDFQIINKDEDENDLVPDGQAGAGIFNCPDDYIAVNSVRLCGERFNDGTEFDDYTINAPVRDIAAGPIMLPVRTDNEYVGRGFRLLYKQELCV